jgi:hypothetical protein
MDGIIRHRSGALPLPVGEKLGVRRGLVLKCCNPSAGALSRADLSLSER